jgi:diacylglycerol O-acyltransferase
LRGECVEGALHDAATWALGHRDLDAAIGEIASTALDRSKPVWEFHFVEGMLDNRFAIIGKVHHALAHGVVPTNLVARALEFSDARRNPRTH